MSLWHLHGRSLSVRELEAETGYIQQEASMHDWDAYMPMTWSALQSVLLFLICSATVPTAKVGPMHKTYKDNNKALANLLIIRQRQSTPTRL